MKLCRIEYFLGKLIFLIIFTYSCQEVINNNQNDYPTCEITNLSDGEIVSDTVLLLVSAEDDKGITKVELYIDDRLYDMDIIPPYSFKWITTDFEDDSIHSIFAMAYDTDDNSTGSEIRFVTINQAIGPPNAVNLYFIDQYGNTGLMPRWTISVEPDFDRYSIYRSTSSGITENSTVIEEIFDKNVTYIIDSNTVSNQEYFYAISVRDTTGQISFSNEVSNSFTSYPDCSFGSDFIITDFAGNPIIPRDSDWNYKTVVDPTVLEANGTFYMWYTGRGSWSYQIGYATSSDGYNWQEYSNNPVVSFGEQGEFDEYHLRYLDVIFDDGMYKMWYSGADNNFSGHVGFSTYNIGYAESSNGINWTKHENNPVMDKSQNSWDNHNIFLGNVMKHEGIYKMWYNVQPSNYDVNIDFIQGNNITLVGYAISTDGITWVKHSEPIMYPGPNLYDDRGLFVHDVEITDNNIYEMFYTSFSSIYNKSISRAVSLDGVNWVKDPLNPIITYEQSSGWRNLSTAGPCFIRNGNEYRFWLRANSDWDSNWNIGTLDGTLICE